MKKLILALIVISFFAATRSSAQTYYTAQYTVPFTFSVSDRVLPAGTYRVLPCSISSSAMMLQNCSQPVTVMFLTQPNYESPDYPGKLVFHQYGQQYFLSEVHVPFVSTSARLPVSNSEKRAQQENATVRTWEEITLPNNKQQR